MEAALILIATAFLSLVAWLGKEKVKSLEDKIKEQDKRIHDLTEAMEEFKENYLDRFEKVNQNINASKEAIIEKIHALEMKNK